jgi:hypothetical protein
MQTSNQKVDRRHFLKSTAAITAGVTSLSLLPTSGWSNEPISDDNPNIIGPREGFSPQVGTLLSMMNWMRGPVLNSVKELTTEQLDYIHDSKSNSIGAMLLHLAATERYYQLNTFDNMKWDSWDNSIKQKWDVAMNLGDDARKNIKGNNLDYYLNILKETRDRTVAEFKKRDDKWLMTVDKDWFWGPTNNYCKWFHVCEHESNHNGQIKWIKGRVPGMKEGHE